MNISKKEKDIFFKNIIPIKDRYNQLLKKSFTIAEEYKKEAIREYLLNNKEVLLNLKKRLEITDT